MDAKQILNIYYEVNYLRHILMLVVNNIPNAENFLNEKTLGECKDKAKEDVIKQIPFLFTSEPEPAQQDSNPS